MDLSLGRVRAGHHIPYETFTRTATVCSSISGAGDGLVTEEALPAFSWVGLYPGAVSAKHDPTRETHTMGSGLRNQLPRLFIIADLEIKQGMHIANEAGPGTEANVWYAKLSCGHVLFFTSRAVCAGEELLTCYARGYGKRCYPVAKKCTDPRCRAMCGKNSHRVESPMLDEWVDALLAETPEGIHLPLNFLS